jgi:tetratricopeptide (TPR) repeat protein
VVGIALIGSGPVEAQDNAAAEALFDEGRRLKDTGDLAGAAEKFRASDRAAPSVGARLNLGDCLAQLGKHASAWASYRAAANLARANADSARAELATGRATAMEPKLTYVILDVVDPVGDLELRWDGEVKAKALWGQRFPIDPGVHEIRATAPGHETWTQTITAGEPGAETRIEVPALEPLPDTGDKKDPGIGIGETPPSGPVTDPSMWTGRRKLAVGIGAAGVVAIGVGSALGLSARSRWNDAEENHCEALECSAEGVELVDSARTRGNISTIAFIAGGAAIAGAAVLWFTGAPAVTPMAGPETAGLSVSGTF